MQLNQIKFCAAECERQRSGELSVYRMVYAFQYATAIRENVANNHLWTLGHLVEPSLNSVSHYRQVRVHVGFHFGVEPDEVPAAMDQLLTNQQEMSPAEFYEKFITIHPLVAGNGRVGAILFNFLSDTLNFPEEPPMYSKTRPTTYDISF